MQVRIIFFFIFSNSLNKIHPGSYIVLWPSIRSFCLLSGLRDKKTLYSISQFYKYPPKTVIHRLVDYCSTQNPLICANIKGQCFKNFILPSHQKIKEGRLRLWEYNGRFAVTSYFTNYTQIIVNFNGLLLTPVTLFLYFSWLGIRKD